MYHALACFSSLAVSLPRKILHLFASFGFPSTSGLSLLLSSEGEPFFPLLWMAQEDTIGYFFPWPHLQDQDQEELDSNTSSIVSALVSQ